MPLYGASTCKDPLFVTIVAYAISPLAFVIVSSLEDSHPVCIYHHWNAVGNGRGIDHSSFSASTSSSFTSNPCSFIVFITADTFCIDGAISLDSVLISSSTSFALSPC